MSPHSRSRANRDCCTHSNSSAAVPAPRRGRAAGAAAAAVTVTAAPPIRPPVTAHVRSQIPLGSVARVWRARGAGGTTRENRDLCVWIRDTGRWTADRAQKRCLGSSLHFAYVRSFLPRPEDFPMGPPAAAAAEVQGTVGVVSEISHPHLK